MITAVSEVFHSKVSALCSSNLGTVPFSRQPMRQVIQAAASKEDIWLILSSTRSPAPRSSTESREDYQKKRFFERGLRNERKRRAASGAILRLSDRRGQLFAQLAEVLQPLGRPR